VRAIATILIVLFICAISIRKPFVGVVTILACAIWRDTVNVETWGAFLDYHCFQLLYIFAILGMIVSRPDAVSQLPPKTAADWGMLGFMGVLVASALVNGVVVFGHKYIDLFFKAMVLYFLLSRLADTPKRVQICSWVIIITTSYLVYLAWDKYRKGILNPARPYGITAYHDFGLQLVITLPLIGTMISQRLRPIIRWLLIALIPLYIMVALRTTSRSSYLGVALGLALLAWYYRRRLHYAVLAIPLVAFAVMHQTGDVEQRIQSIWTHRTETGEKDTSIQMRLEQMRTAMNVIQSNPVFGLGPRQFFSQYKRYVDASHTMGWTYTMHSVPLLIACEEGALGLIVFYGLIVLGSLRTSVRAMKLARGRPALVSVAIVSTGALMGFLAWLAYSLTTASMWVVNIYATVALTAAGYRVIEHYIEAGVAEEDEEAVAKVPTGPTTQIAFT